jgi:SAM-dependent methyltransferase
MAQAARYDTIGQRYTDRRGPDPRIAARIAAALGAAKTAVNVGAGTGSYEETRATRAFVAAEPSAVMIAQRRSDTAPAVRASAEHLPFAARSFDVALAVLTVHHWSDLRLGLSELRRVARRQVVVTIDPTVHDHMWLIEEYFPAIAGLSDGAPLADVVEALHAHTVEVILIPADCRDGFLMAYWRRPERYLDAAVRANTSGFALLGEEDTRPGLSQLAADLDDGTWHRRHADLVERAHHDLGLRLVLAG